MNGYTYTAELHWYDHEIEVLKPVQWNGDNSSINNSNTLAYSRDIQSPIISCSFKSSTCNSRHAFIKDFPCPHPSSNYRSYREDIQSWLLIMWLVCPWRILVEVWSRLTTWMSSCHCMLACYKFCDRLAPENVLVWFCDKPSFILDLVAVIV